MDSNKEKEMKIKKKKTKKKNSDNDDANAFQDASSKKEVDVIFLDQDIYVDKGLAKTMKPHQVEGVKFLWDACFGSIERPKESGGCILAHCMGMGKTLQAISLIHTLFTIKKIQKVLIISPLSTLLNWCNEFQRWIGHAEKNRDLHVTCIYNVNYNKRVNILKKWHQDGGVIIIGYEMFRSLVNGTFKDKKLNLDFEKTLINPGPELIVCDEGHLLKNERTALSQAVSRIKTLRRIVLTGTPLQNNLVEYHCMINLIKPNLLGSREEFKKLFVNPITNGQFADSTERDIKIMKRRAHVLHKLLDAFVQRRNYNMLTPYLPPKQEYVLLIRLTDLQVKLYRECLMINKGTITFKGLKVKGLFADFQQLSRVWSHPLALKFHLEKQKKEKEKNYSASDSAGLLKDVVVDGSSNEGKLSSSSSNVEDSAATKRLTRGNKKDDEDLNKTEDDPEAAATKSAWWSNIVKPEHFDDISVSKKLLLLFDFLKHCEEMGEKILVFSQSLYSLDLIEHFLNAIDKDKQKDDTSDNPLLLGHKGSWSIGLDYFRLDGSTKGENRSAWIESFNRESNTRARLFLISTRAGGLGINLTAANRVIIFDASWNPSYDTQSIYRIYRLGQHKPCYIYRFIAQGTMEEKIYERQISKLSLSKRVVDEQQVNRHFTQHDLQELYNFAPANMEDAPIHIVPEDDIMADMLQKHKACIYKIFEHHSLLDHVEEEELDEEERKAAWEDYENEKKRGQAPPMPAGDLQEAGGSTEPTASDKKIKKTYYCEFCDYKGSRLDNFKIHLRTHTGETPFSCEFCDYKSAASSNMTRHLKKHTNEKLFSCEFCDYKSSASYNMKRHRLGKHSDEKTFQL